MAKKTVLEYVQAALDTIKGMQVDSINDTEESLVVANFLKECYDEFIGRDILGYPWLRRPIVLTAAADVASPTRFSIPDNVARVLWLKYEVEGKWQEVCWEEPKDFICLHSSANSVQVTDDYGLKFYVRSDLAPSKYTSLDNNTIYCDAFDQSVESTLQGSKFQAYGVVRPTLALTDASVPDLPEHFVPLLQGMVNQMASYRLRETASPLDDAIVNRQMADTSMTKDRFQLPEFKGRKYGRR